MSTTKSKPRLLVIDDDRVLRSSLADFLSDEGYDADAVPDGSGAFKRLAAAPHQLVIADLAAAGEGFLRRLAKEHAETFSIVLTAYGSIEEAVAATRAGAFDYLVKPIVDDEIRLSVKRAISQQALLHDNNRLKKRLDDTFGLGDAGGIVGSDTQMRKVFETVAQVADTPTTVLVSGESGTGKSLLARSIHQLSGRRDGPFVEVACGALPEQLLETELFGHLKGAFTGADRDRVGRLQLAEGGTLFLDEINSASLAMQVKLLRVLQEKLYEPVGSSEPRRADVRFVLATNADLETLVAAGTFRQDLFYRINVVTLDLPPLRDRPADVPLLAEHFLEQFRTQLKRDVGGFTPEAAEVLSRYAWPGNIRELENAVERATVLCQRLTIDVDDLPSPIRQGRQTPQLSMVPAELADVAELPLREAMEALERPILMAALERNSWSRQKTAEALGINRATLFKKMRRFRLDVPA